MRVPCGTSDINIGGMKMSEFSDLMDALLEAYDDPNERYEAAYNDHKEFALSCIANAFVDYEVRKRRIARNALKHENVFVHALTKRADRSKVKEMDVGSELAG